MKQSIQFWIASGLALCTFATTSLTQAQIVPDATLPQNSSVTLDGNTSIINEGTAVGGNLFHSFEQFSIPTGSASYFNNALDIHNIISRVTGASISNIDGLIRANGTANLFLINPNGIIFGPNATLAIGGSFLGSTAGSVNFADGNVFSATTPQTTPLLTVSVPVGLQFGGTTGSIVNQSRATNSSGGVGLQVQPRETLALLGGDVRLEGGQMQALGGHVELGGLAATGSVGLSMNNSLMSLSFPEGVARADVYLTDSVSNRARVNVAASNGGSIAINARNIDISGGSELHGGIEERSGFLGAQAGDISLNATREINLANGLLLNRVEPEAIGNAGSINITTGSLSIKDGARLGAATLGNGNAGNVTITAQDTVSLDGMGSNLADGVFTQVFTGGIGNAGNINITTGSLYMKNDVQIAVSTFNQGSAGKVTIIARDTVSLEGRGTAVRSSVVTTGVGNAGNINITTGSLSLTDGAQLLANTEGQGKAGNVTIDARNSISLDGVGIDRNNNPLASGIFSIVERGMGDGGNIKVTAGSLSVTNGARLNANTNGRGNAGNVTINTRDTVSLDGVNSLNGNSGGVFSRVDDRGVGNGGNINVTTGSLFATNGARLNAGSRGQGNAGSITINARDTVFLDGVGSNRNSSGVVSGVALPADSSINVSSPGQGGNLTIKTGQLIVQNNAEVNVTSERLGSAGEIRVEADSIELNDQGELRAEAELSQGGNINLQVRDLILMRRQGLISATAGGMGNGGNVTIGNATNAPLVVAFPTEDSDIIAQASEGQGGNINIFTQGIFGLEARNPTTSQTSDINASSEVGIDGTVEINRLDIDPSQGLVALPAELVDASRLIAQRCPGGGGTVGRGASEFIITGRGGLPPSPSEALRSDAVRVDLRASTVPAMNHSGGAIAPQSPRPTAVPLVEAQGWVTNARGEVILTATAPTLTPYSPWLTSADCQPPKNSS